MELVRDKDAETRLNRIMAEAKEAQTIRCPWCKEPFEEGEDYYDYISYHGEEGPQETECSHCGKGFFVEERVIREYTCGNKLDGCGFVMEGIQDNESTDQDQSCDVEADADAW